MSVCLVLIQNYFKRIFQTFVSLVFRWGKGEINGCGACKIYMEIAGGGGGGQKIFIYRFKRTVIEIVSLFWVLMAPVIPEKVSC